MINNNIIKKYLQTTGLIQRLINISHLLSIGVIVAEKLCLLVVPKLVLRGKQFLTKQKNWQIWQGTGVEDILGALG